MNVTAATGGVWQVALAHLQETSFRRGCVPSARQWLDFFSSCTHTPAAGTTYAGGIGCISPLPRQVSSLIAESVLDAARFARLQQLLSSSGGVLRDSHLGVNACRKEADHVHINVGGIGSSISDGADLSPMDMPEDVGGEFLVANPNCHPTFQSDLVQILCCWCASHETPCGMEQLVCWLRNVTDFLRFFTLHEAQHPSQKQQQRWKRLYLVYTETLSVLHHALGVMFLRPSQPGEDMVMMDMSSPEMQEEVALLALWLLRASDADTLDPFTGMLQNTQKLLASCKRTQPWLLHLPAFLRSDKKSGSCCSVVRGGDFLSDMQRRSSICQLAAELHPAQSRAASPSVEVPFVDVPAIRDAAVVYAMDQKLSRIALGDNDA